VKRIAIAAVVMLAASPATAAAKEITGMKVCGANGCATVSQAKDFWNLGTPRQTFDAPVSRYYRLEVTIGDRGRPVATETVYWLRGARLTHGADQSSFDPWSRLSAAQSHRLERAAKGLSPLKPTLSSVSIDGKRVGDASSYIRLFGHFRVSYGYPAEGARTVTVVVTPAHPNPWLSRRVTLRYYPELRQLERPDYEDVTLPAALRPMLSRRSGASHAALVGGIAAAGLAAVGAFALVRRRRGDG
jgi:hypothetical protein